MSLLDFLLNWSNMVPSASSQAHCAACGGPILKSCLTALGQTWHPEHFCCGVCHRPLTGQFSLSRHREPFCNLHSQNQVLCQCCGHLILGTQATGEFCAACRTDIPQDAKVLEPLLTGIQARLRNEGLPWWPQSFPLRLVAPDEMKISKPQKGAPLAPLAGLIRKVSTSDAKGRPMRSVPEIRLLRGRPSLMQGAVIAHELGHAWIFQKGICDLPADLEEGFCEFCSYLWISSSNDPRAAYQMERIALNPDPTYGGGFRKIRDLGGKRGLPGVLDGLAALNKGSQT